MGRRFLCFCRPGACMGASYGLWVDAENLRAAGQQRGRGDVRKNVGSVRHDVFLRYKGMFGGAIFLIIAAVLMFRALL